MRVATVLGARPQFIKAFPVSAALEQRGHVELLIHTGQHYDHAMSGTFFEELGIREPHVNLEVGSGAHGAQTGQMLARVEEVLTRESPDWVLVYGDTNSTLAGALAACKLQIPLAHVEAGLRSYNRCMPEEHNRVLTDHCADLLFCPTETARRNLAREGIEAAALVVGDTMYDAVRRFAAVARASSRILDRLGLAPGNYVLATLHRAYNTDDRETLASFLSTLAEIAEPVVFPVHPRTRARLQQLDPATRESVHAPGLRLIDPLGYLDMLQLEQNARVILTDSGGVQKEAYFFGVPCITLRPETEWVETVTAGMNIVTGTDRTAVLSALAKSDWPREHPSLFGDGCAAARIVRALEERTTGVVP